MDWTSIPKPAPFVKTPIKEIIMSVIPETWNRKIVIIAVCMLMSACGGSSSSVKPDPNIQYEKIVKIDFKGIGLTGVELTLTGVIPKVTSSNEVVISGNYALATAFYLPNNKVKVAAIDLAGLDGKYLLLSTSEVTVPSIEKTLCIGINTNVIPCNVSATIQ